MMTKSPRLRASQHLDNEWLLILPLGEFVNSRFARQLRETGKLKQDGLFMCGRFTQQFSYAELHAYFSFFGQPLGNIEPRFNICPTQAVTVVLSDGGQRHFPEHMRWGLVPSWWKKPLKELPATFNARAETVTEKPTFRSAFRSRRCVIPASGTFEWQDVADGKQPWYFTPANGPLMLIAGLWESWNDPAKPGETVRSTTMIITGANGFVGQYHDRMPVLLGVDDMAAWLSGEKGVELLRPAANDVLKAWPVARTINSSRAKDESGLIAPVEPGVVKRLI